MFVFHDKYLKKKFDNLIQIIFVFIVHSIYLNNITMLKVREFSCSTIHQC